VPPEGGTSALEEALGADSITARALAGPSNQLAYDERWNRPELLRAEIPSSNGVGNARALARAYAATVGHVEGVRLLSPETVADARHPESEGPDKVLILPTRFGLGFALTPMLAPGCGPNAFGHPGAGGSLGFADPDHALGFGYVMNRMKLGLQADERAGGLVEAVYACL
jgi:CubicO group peptidase (beta-lactamase class C family)